MTTIVLVRHAQASFGSGDYDQLSPLGFEQARHLGQHLRQAGERFDRQVTGSLLRHRQTSETAQLLPVPAERLPGLDEIESRILIDAHLKAQQRELPEPGDQSAFFGLLGETITAWSQDAIPGDLPESWQQFQQRVRESLAAVLAGDPERVIVVTSGGTISALLCVALDQPVAAMIDSMLAMQNTAITQLGITAGRARLEAFNQLPHLRVPGREHLITWI